MKEEFGEIHRNSKDIIQKLLLFSFPVGTDPFAFLGKKVGKILSVEPTDIVAVRTVDDAADVLYRLEKDVILHVEIQTNYKKDDIYRFAEYDAFLLNNKYKEEDVAIQTVVIYTHNVNPNTAITKFNKGSIQYSFTPIYLKNQDGNAYFSKIKDKIQKDPSIKLTPEDIMILLYIPLMHTKESFSDSIISITEVVKGLQDENQKFRTIGTILAFHHKKLEDDLINKLWEVLKTMGGAIFEEFRKEIYDEAKSEAAERMVERGFSDETIIDVLRISSQDLREIKRKLKNK